MGHIAESPPNSVLIGYPADLLELSFLRRKGRETKKTADPGKTVVVQRRARKRKSRDFGDYTMRASSQTREWK